jgi:hypothetical protein
MARQPSGETLNQSSCPKRLPYLHLPGHMTCNAGPRRGNFRLSQHTSILHRSAHHPPDRSYFQCDRVPFKPHDYFSSNLFQTALQDQMVGSFNEHDADDELGYKSKTIKRSLYEQHDPHYVANQQIHLSTSQR